MSSKRQQARNERALQDLIKSVPGNSTCADCGAANPGWASWSLGVFLCLRCAALHRKLGTHISKVKSLSMDSWSTEQVENMKKVGNVASNRKYNSSNSRPPMPIDEDEVDSTMERYIRKKYAGPGVGGSGPRGAYGGEPERRSGSSDDIPPPLPPKTGMKFGFRSASSIFPMSSSKKREAAARAYLENQDRERQYSGTPPLHNREREETNSPTEMETKLRTLRDMGFDDEKKNSTVLKGLNGNLEKTIETLIRLGESSGPSSRSRTPLSPKITKSAGISFDQASTNKVSAVTNDPWDISPPPQTAQSTGNLDLNPFNRSASSNPYGLQPSQSHATLNQQYQLDQQFANLSVAQPQALFPHHTGGTPLRPTFQQAGAPPLPPIPQGQYQGDVFTPTQQNFNPFQQMPQQHQQPPPQQLQPQQQQPQSTHQYGALSSAPFASTFSNQSRSATFPLQSQQTSMFDQVPQQQQQSNPFLQIQQQQNPYQNLLQSQPQSNPFGVLNQGNIQQIQQPQQNNPYGIQPQQNLQFQQQPQQFSPYASQGQQPTQQPQYNQQYQPQQLKPQKTGKNEIMALYNIPHAAPPLPQAIPQFDQSTNQQAQQYQSSTTQQQQQQQQQQYMGGLLPHAGQQEQVAGVPSSLAGSKNPFMSPGGGGMTSPVAAQNGAARHISHESISVGPNWYDQSGRHSPDAFASLSARSMR